MNRHEVADTGSDPKGGDLCEARNRGRREIEGKPCARQEPGAKMCEEPGNEHKEKPSGASTDREAEIA